MADLYYRRALKVLFKDNVAYRRGYQLCLPRDQEKFMNIQESGTQLNPKWDAAGLITAVVTDAATGSVLMVAHMDARALRLTLDTGEAHFWSRSRAQLWKKGETSGHVLDVVEVRIDCDQDALWLRCKPRGPACHTGEVSCFYRVIEGGELRRRADTPKPTA
jgi:phosphoribosyl-AMP cyclohydrolase